MYNKVKNIIKKFQDLTILGVANVAGSLISGVFWLFLAPLLGTANYGEVSYFIAICGIASIVSFFGAGNTIIVYSAKGVNIQRPLFFIVTISGLITSIILFFIFYKIGVSLYIIGYVIFGLATAELLGLKLYKSYSTYLIIQKILFVCFAIFFYYIIGTQGVILGFALSFFPFSHRLYKELRGSKIDFSVIKPRLGFMINSYVLDLSRTFSGSTDKLIIYPLLGFSLLGNYQLGVQFLSLLSLLPSIVYQYILPHDASGNPNKKLKKITIVVSIGLSITAIVLGPFVIPHLFPKFSQAVTVVQITSVGVIPLTINLMYISKFLGAEKNRIVLIGSGIYLLAQIPSIFILGKIYGLNGAAAALVIATSAESVFLFLMNHFSKIISTVDNTVPEINSEKSEIRIEKSEINPTDVNFSQIQSSFNSIKTKLRLDNPIILIAIIATIGLSLRIYYFPWKIPVTLDALSFFWYAIDTNILGHLPSSNSSHNGWPILLAFFFKIMHSSNFMDYMNLQRLISTVISVMTIIPVYLLCVKFVNKQYALLGALIFAVEPHIIQNSLLGISDPLYILLTSIALVLFLRPDKKSTYISFAIVALSSVVRIEGFAVFFAFSFLFFMKNRNKKSIIKYAIAAGIFFLILLPIAFLRIQSTGSDQLTSRIAGDIVELSTTQNEKLSLIPHIGQALEMFIRFLASAMIPIFIVLVPIGIILILRKRIQNIATIIITGTSMLLAAFYAYFESAPDSRYIFPVFPIFCILSVFAIKELEIKIKKKNMIVILIIILVVISSILFLHFKINNEHERESLSLAYYITNSTTGINPYTPESKYLPIPEISNKQFPILSTSIQDGPKLISTMGFKSLVQYITYGQKNGLTHLVLDGSNSNPAFLNDVYAHEEKYPYLNKIYDSLDHGYKYHLKIFKVDYRLFESTVKTQ